MVRKRSGPITSTTCPIARSSSATVASVRTTPLTCGNHASVTIRMRCDGAGGSIASHPRSSMGDRVSGSLRQPGLARGEERELVERRPIDQLQPAVVMLDQRGAALHPVTVVDVKHAGHLAHFGVMDVAANHAVEAAPPRLRGDGAFEPVDRL